MSLRSNTLKNPIVVSGLGALTPWGDSAVTQGKLLDQAPDCFTLKDFDRRKRVPDRKMLKAISHSDAMALVALDDMRKNIGYQDDDGADPMHKGLFVGAPAATAADNELYMEALQAAEGQVSQFGTTCMTAKPVTLLLGLPNNVLCYGAMLLDAKGANNNYTAMGSSGFLALINAYRRVAWGKLDTAYCGGFSAHSNEVDSRMFAAHGVAKEEGLSAGRCQVTDAAVFACLESHEQAEQAGRKPIAAIAGYGFANVGTPPFDIHQTSSRYEKMLRRTLSQVGIRIDDVGLILSGSCGVPSLDTLELSSLRNVFEACDTPPALGGAALAAGNMMEASGLYELTLLDALYQKGKVPEALRPKLSHQEPFAEHFTDQLDSDKPYIVVSKISLTGQACVLVLRKENQQ